MKALLPSLFLLLLVVASCQSEKDNVAPSTVTGKWLLTKIVPTNKIAAKASTPVTLPYTETYEFKADSTFRRYRSNGYEATGTYSFVRNNAGEQAIIISFDDPDLNFYELHGFKHSSFSQSKEQLYLSLPTSDELTENHISHDGPIFYYQKVENGEYKKTE